MSLEYPCVYYADGKCKKYDGDGVVSYCVLGPCSDERKSNADRIRAMTDEELAKELSFIGDCRCPDGGECGHENGCLWCWQNWLRQEAQSD